jgi:hypothetical protein
VGNPRKIRNGPAVPYSLTPPLDDPPRGPRATSGDLTGVAGTATLTVDDDGGHQITFDYALPDTSD